MAGEGIFSLKTATHGSSLADATHARAVPQTAFKEDNVKEEVVVTEHELAVEVYGNDAAELYARIGEAAASLVIEVEGRTGTDETHTFLLVEFVEIIAPVDIPEKDGGGKIAPAGIKGWCQNPDNLPYASIWTVA